MASSTRKENVHLVKLAEQTKRFEDMAELMDKVLESVDEGEELSFEERNLLSEAYKKAIIPRNKAWKLISGTEKKEESKWDKNKVLLKYMKVHKAKVEDEMANICSRILNLLDSRLIDATNVANSKAYFLKMKGDYHRYLAEFKTGTEREEHVENAINAYKAGQHIAWAELATTNPTRLALAFNFSLFYYLIFESPEKAREVAMRGYHEAIDNLDKSDESYKETIHIMQLLLDNIREWNDEMEELRRRRKLGIHFPFKPTISSLYCL